MKILQADDDGVKKAASTIRGGGVVVFPSEAGYLLGCLPSDPQASKRICEARQSATEPLPLLCGSVGDARRIVEFNPAAERIAERLWPGPLALVLPRKVDYPMWVTRRAKTLTVGVPLHPAACSLSKASGGVIVGETANVAGGEPPGSGREAAEMFGGKADLVLDGGPASAQAFTVLDASTDELWVLRAGAVTGEQIREALRSL